MINKENKVDINNTLIPDPLTENGYLDIAKVDVQCHLLIKDKDTGEILVNKRG